MMDLCEVEQGRSDRYRNAPLWRILCWVLICLLPAQANGAWFEPQMEAFSGCTDERVVSGQTLKALSVTSALYYTRVDNAGDSKDAQLFDALGMAGEISYSPVYRQDTEVADEQSIVLTGTVYKRKASRLESLLGKGRSQLYYEVRVSDETFLLNVEAFNPEPFDTCDRAKSV